MRKARLVDDNSQDYFPDCPESGIIGYRPRFEFVADCPKTALVSSL